jgi:hypothetical protein
MYVVAMVTRNDRKYGGAVSPWALTAVNPTVWSASYLQMVKNPLSLRIVGKKTGRDAKLTLQEKYMSCDVRIFYNCMRYSLP